MNPALYKHRITFQKDKGIKDADGFPIPENERYENVKTVWAMIKTLNDKGSAYEFYAAATTHEKNTISFVIRYTTGITPDMKIKYRNRSFEILSVINDNEANKTLTIVGKEVI